MKESRKRGALSGTLVYYKSYLPAYCATLTFMLLYILAALLQPQIPQLVIDKILKPAFGEEASDSGSSVFAFMIKGFEPDDYFGMLWVLGGIMVALSLVRSISHYARWNISHWLMIRAENDMRHYAFGTMLRQSPLILNKYTSGDLLNVTNNDTVAIKDLYLYHMPFLLNSTITIAIAIIFLLRINPWLTPIPIVMGLITAVVARRYNKILRLKYRKIRDSNVQLSTYIQENINGVRIVRAFATEDDEMKRFEQRNVQFRDTYVDLARTTSKYSMIFTVLGECVGILSMILGIIFAVRGSISTGEFATFTSYCMTINNNIIAMAGQIGNIQNSVICADRFFEFADRPLAVDEPASPVPAPEKPAIEFRNVSMRFEDGQYALENVDFKVEYGKRVGIMGKTGSGKSVMFKLMNRLYDCTSGEILLGGVNIKDIPVDEVRREYSYVMQDVFLFSESVTNNIAFYDEDASDERVKKAAAAACVDEFVPALEDGYDTIVGERGLGLSGGQKQRVSIARALLKDAPIILLDDCTSALDYETEKKITDNLYREYGDRTMLVSSHRAGSVAHCDEIIFLEDGKIAERGSHEELMALKGRYYAIYSEQELLRKEALE